MPRSFSFTGTDEIRKVESEMNRAARVAPIEARKVVSKGLLNIKNDARRLGSGIAHAPTYPYTINYDVEQTPGGAKGEVGPDKQVEVGGGRYRTPGNLGAILEFGTPNSAPIPHMTPAGEREEPKFVKAMEDAALKALGW